MSYHDIITFVEQNPVCTIATAEQDQPHVRGFLTNIIEDKIYFTTSLDKRVGKQITQNQKSELCYLAPDFSTMLRITTTLEILDDKKIKQHLIDNREYLKHFDVNDPSFILFTLSNSQATFWKLADNLKEDGLKKILF